MRNKPKKFRSAVTLVELLVSVTVFTVLVGLATASFITVLRAQRQALAFAQVQGNAAVALEIMAKEVRTGREFSVTNSGGLCPGIPACRTGSSLRFTNIKGQTAIYSLNSGKIERQVMPNPFQAISAGNVVVSSLQFFLQGGEPGDGRQPLVTIIMTVSAIGAKPEQAVNIDVQTSIAPRELEL